MPKKGVSGQKQKKLTVPLNSAHLVSLGAKFQLKLAILILWTKFAQKVIPVKNGKSEHHH